MVAGHAPHALLIAGRPGVGKTTLALDLAAGLLCTIPIPSAGRAGSVAAAGSSITVAIPTFSGSPRPARSPDPDRRPDDPEQGTIRRLTPTSRCSPSRAARASRSSNGPTGWTRRPVGAAEDPRGAAGRGHDRPLRGRDDLMPTVHSRCVRIRLGRSRPRHRVRSRGRGPADASRAARLARLSAVARVSPGRWHGRRRDRRP